MLKDTAIDTGIGLMAYGLATGTMSLATAGLLVAGVTLLGVVCRRSHYFNIGFEHLIRAIFGYWD